MTSNLKLNLPYHARCATPQCYELLFLYVVDEVGLDLQLIIALGSSSTQR